MQNTCAYAVVEQLQKQRISAHQSLSNPFFLCWNRSSIAERIRSYRICNLKVFTRAFGLFSCLFVELFFSVFFEWSFLTFYNSWFTNLRNSQSQIISVFVQLFLWHCQTAYFSSWYQTQIPFFKLGRPNSKNTQEILLQASNVPTHNKGTDV